MTGKPPPTEPRPGLVIRYAYLWREQAEDGQQEGKDRPCAVVIAAKRDDGKLRVYVAPITTTPPSGEPKYTIEVPAETKHRLGLDHRPSWIVTKELNVFTWPGPDVRLVGRPGEHRGFAYGHLPQNMTKDLAANIKERVREGKTKPVNRDEPSPPAKGKASDPGDTPPAKDWTKAEKPQAATARKDWTAKGEKPTPAIKPTPKKDRDRG